MIIHNNDNKDMVIVVYLSSDKYQNEWAVARNWNQLFCSKVDCMIIYCCVDENECDNEKHSHAYLNALNPKQEGYFSDDGFKSTFWYETCCIWLVIHWNMFPSYQHWFK